ncbi:MAG: hypothetical protein AAGF95_10130 [Chloroflexota bacterium]
MTFSPPVRCLVYVVCFSLVVGLSVLSVSSVRAATSDTQAQSEPTSFEKTFVGFDWNGFSMSVAVADAKRQKSSYEKRNNVSCNIFNIKKDYGSVYVATLYTRCSNT